MSEVKRVGTSEAAFSIILFRYLVEIVYLLDCIVFTLTYPVHPTAGLPFKLLFPLSSFLIVLNLHLSLHVQGDPQAEKSETMKKPTRRPGVKPPPEFRVYRVYSSGEASA